PRLGNEPSLADSFPVGGDLQSQFKTGFQIRLIEARKRFGGVVRNEKCVQKVIPTMKSRLSGNEAHLDAIMSHSEGDSRNLNMALYDRNIQFARIDRERLGIFALEIQNDWPQRAYQIKGDLFRAADWLVRRSWNQEPNLIRKIRDLIGPE